VGKRFVRKKENFVCQKCGNKVTGNGYTNHCPKCLFSLHVDVNPGDRTCSCHGLMEPVSIESTGDGYVIVHKCTVCGAVKRNKSAENDSFDTILEVSRRSAQNG